MKTDFLNPDHSGHAFATQIPLDRPKPDLIEAIRAEAKAEGLTCARALALARVFSCPPEQVGRHSDLLNIRIRHCQLGLFGSHSGPDPLKPGFPVNPALEEAIREQATHGRLPCLTAWKLAEQFGLAKITLARLCERWGLKISQCQLGLF